MKHWIFWMALGASFGWILGCASDPYAGPRFDSLRNDPAGWIVLQSLKRQGYLAWKAAGGMVCNVRTRESLESRDALEVETFSMDLGGRQRFASRGNRGAVFVQRIYQDGAYREIRDREAMTHSEELESGRLRLLYNGFFTRLPFLLFEGGAVLTPADPATLEGVRFDVVEARFEPAADFPPDSWYRLYFTHATHLLEKVFFKVGQGPQAGKGVWCDLDNFGEYDGAVIPLHLVFTEAADEQGARAPRPFREQWIFEVQFGVELDEEEFIR